MSCLNPYKGWVIGVTESGKAKLMLTSYDVHSITKMPAGNYFQNKTKIVNGDLNTQTKFLTIPCGKCLECRLDYARTWASRCMMEAQLHESSYFVTLTYDDEYIPVSITNSDGEFMSSLCKKDFQDFMKRLRERTGQKLRYFACGEYGSKTKRPHYHALIFGLHLDDLVLYSKNGRGDLLYNSKFMDSVWKKGYVVIGDLTYDSACYTARYVVKKALNDDSDLLDDLGFEKEFVLMSRNPGIGKEFYEQHKDEFRKYGHVYIPTSDGSLKVISPRYFNNFLEEEFPGDFFEAKRKREQMADVSEEFKSVMSSKDTVSRNKDLEEFKKAKLKALERSL